MSTYSKLGSCCVRKQHVYIVYVCVCVGGGGWTVQTACVNHRAVMLHQ